MNDFTFQNTTKIYFGTKQINNLHKEVLKYGDRVLLAYGGKSAKKLRVYEDVLKEFKENGITLYELGGIEPNPRHTTVNKGVELCRKYGIQSIVAIGGGSTIDCCKAIAATTLSTSNNSWDLVEGKVKWSDALAVIAIPTIASSGSEMDKSCVIANEEIGVKGGISGEAIRPKAAFLDPTNTFSVPPIQTACGGFDIMAHLLDMNYFVNSEKYPLQFNVVETILKQIRKYLPIAIKEPSNYEARATLLWSASWALNSFCTSGFKTYPSLHLLEQFSATYDLTHGLALGIITPKWMKYLLDRDKTVAEDFARFGINVLGIKDDKNQIEVAYKTIEVFQDFIKDELNIPVSLSEIGLDDSKFEEMADKALGGLKSLSAAYRELTREDILGIYNLCL